MDRLLTADEVCTRLNIKKHYLYRLTSERRIPHYKMGTALHFKESDIEEWKERHYIPEGNNVMRYTSVV